MKRLKIVLVVIVMLIWCWVIIVSFARAEAPCHPGMHICLTDSECEMEENMFLLFESIIDQSSVFDLPYITTLERSQS